MGGIPPNCRNHLVPTGCETPASLAASALDAPRAIASQNWTRSSRRAADGRPGDLIEPRIARTASSHLPTAIANTSILKMLQRSVESTLST